jgi:hypothetical protein
MQLLIDIILIVFFQKRSPALAVRPETNDR